MAVSGKIGNWEITSQGDIQQYKTFSGGGDATVKIGNTILADGSLVAFFANDKTNPGGTNGALYARASGATNNIAAEFSGNVLIHNGTLVANGFTAPSSYEIQYSPASGANRKMTFKNGLFIKDEVL